MTAVLDLGPAEAGHLVMALAAHKRALRAHGVALPEPLEDLAALARRTATGDASSDCERQGATSLDEFAAFLHPPAMLLTLAEVAQALSLSERQVGRLVHSGDLRSVVIGSARRVRTADLAQYVEGLPSSPLQARIRAKEAPNGTENAPVAGGRLSPGDRREGAGVGGRSGPGPTDDGLVA